MRNYAEQYQYDDVGNFSRLAHAVPDALGQYQNLWSRTYTPAPTSNRLRSTLVGDGSSSTSVTYVHDKAGNVASMQSGSLPTLDWDYRNQLLHAVGSRGDNYFAYDSGGQRVRKVLVKDNVVKERIYLGTYEIYRERKLGSDTIALDRRTLHLNDDRRRIVLVELLVVGTPATPTNINDGPQRLIRYQLDNHLGSAVVELDSGGRLLSYEEYHPYGTTAYSATDGILAMNRKRYGYTGKERDEETGLGYHGARYYAPWLGRWLSADPAPLGDGTNLYAYARSNPVRFVDKTGTKSASVEPLLTELYRSYEKTHGACLDIDWLARYQEAARANANQSTIGTPNPHALRTNPADTYLRALQTATSGVLPAATMYISQQRGESVETQIEKGELVNTLGNIALSLGAPANKPELETPQAELQEYNWGAPTHENKDSRARRSRNNTLAAELADV